MVFIGVAVRRVKAYFTGRFSEEYAGEELSGAIQMRSGVPPGSELGLILFLLIVNNLQYDIEALVLNLQVMSKW